MIWKMLKKIQDRADESGAEIGLISLLTCLKGQVENLRNLEDRGESGGSIKL